MYTKGNKLIENENINVQSYLSFKKFKKIKIWLFSIFSILYYVATAQTQFLSDVGVNT